VGIPADLFVSRSGIWTFVFGSEVYGLWFMVHGLWCMVYGVWFMVYSLWFIAWD
jgi:hypothetical protein